MSLNEIFMQLFIRNKSKVHQSDSEHSTKLGMLNLTLDSLST